MECVTFLLFLSFSLCYLLFFLFFLFIEARYDEGGGFTFSISSFQHIDREKGQFSYFLCFSTL